MNKKKGSAMILAILLLAFFMALSLNMWFISQKKAQRAGDKIIGNSVLTDIDGSSTLGYYEFYLATEYMTKGFVTTGIYTIPASTVDYTSGGAITPTIQGIWLENEKEYFGSYLDTSGGAFNYNALLREDTIVSNKLSERNWEITGGGITKELWEKIDETSFGGYVLSDIKKKGKTEQPSAYVSIKSNIESNSNKLSSYLVTGTIGEYTLQSIYVKTINLNSSNNTKNQSTTYNINVIRTSEIETNGSNYNVNSDQIDEIIVTKQ